MTSKIQPWDKLVSNQAFVSDHYAGTLPIEQRLYETILWSSGISAPDKNFRIERTDLFSIEEMASNAVALGLITWLLQLSRARHVLEVGTFVGVSAMHFAASLPADGRVVTIEKFDHFAAIARRNFEANGLQNRIELIEGDAHEVLPTLRGRAPFDFAFIDGNKERYADYFHLIAPMMSPTGIIAVDDAFFNGDVLNPKPHSEKGGGVREFLEAAAGASSWKRILLPLTNGMMLMHRVSPA
jgi:predicted O-methyltransferase YrrM